MITPRVLVLAASIAGLLSTGISGTVGAAPPPAEGGYSGPPVMTTLYGHIFDILQPVPINTQQPIDLDLARGFLLPTLTAQGAGQGPTQNRLYLYATAGFVEYNVSTRQPRLHPERGISFDVPIDKSASIIGHWFMSADALETSIVGEPPVHGGIIPGMTVRATMRTEMEVGRNLDAGQLIAQGGHTQDVIVVPGQEMVYEFTVDMGAAQMDIPAEEGFNVKFEWYQLDNDGVQFMDRQWNLHTGIKYPNRIELPIVTPIAILFIHPQFLGDTKVAVHTQFNSPWGNYDIDPETLRVQIQGPSQATRISDPIIVQHTWIHNHHTDPVSVTWVWDYTADRAEPGEYTVTVEGQNLQHTATATKVAKFTIRKADDGGLAAGDIVTDKGEVVTTASGDATDGKTVPGFGLLPLAGALAAAGLVAVRRRKA